MKKIFILLLVNCALFNISSAQSEKYTGTMLQKIAVLDTARQPATLTELANTFERIGAAEKTQWLPYYYAALSNINHAYQLVSSNNVTSIDPLTDKAEAMVNMAEGLEKNNAEIYILKKMVASLRYMVDPPARYMQYAPLAQQAMEKAKSIDPNNPRIYLLEGQDKFFTPEQFGGSKTEAKQLFEIASQKFAAFKPATELSPNWGRGNLQYFLAQVNK